MNKGKMEQEVRSVQPPQLCARCTGALWRRKSYLTAMLMNFGSDRKDKITDSISQSDFLCRVGGPSLRGWAGPLLGVG